MAIAAAIGIGAVMAAGSYMQTKNNNKSIRASSGSALQANAASAAYLDVKNANEQSKLAKNYAKFLAKESALSSAKGTYTSASFEAATNTAIMSAETDSGVMDFNTRAQKTSNNAATRAQIIQNWAGYKNPFFSIIQGGAQGAMMGYSLGSMFGASGAAAGASSSMGPGASGLAQSGTASFTYGF